MCDCPISQSNDVEDGGCLFGEQVFDSYCRDSWEFSHLPCEWVDAEDSVVHVVVEADEEVVVLVNVGRSDGMKGVSYNPFLLDFVF